jgi:glycosyltransferase involved in cell wall biosynthesis
VFSGFGLRADIVPNLVDLAKFRFRERQPLRPRILSTRNFEPTYNVACTLRAFQVVQQHHPEASLTLVGGGSEAPKLTALAEALDLHHVTFAGRVSPDLIAGYYDSHDIYVQSPDIDNMPVSVLEAYASGLPVVSTGVGGIPAILTHARHGLLAPPGDHQQLGRCLLQLLEDPLCARDLARNAFDTCHAYTWATLRRQWLGIYRDMSSAN